MKDVITLSTIAFLLSLTIVDNLSFEKQWPEDKLWPAVEVNENTGRVHAGCASFEYLPSKAFDNLDYIKQRENRTYILSGNIVIENEIKDGVNMILDLYNVEENTVIELPYIYYLGYDVEAIDSEGKVQKIETFESENGFVAIQVPETAKRINVTYTGTTLMKITYIVFGITFIGVCGYLIINWHLKKKEKTKD